MINYRTLFILDHLGNWKFLLTLKVYIPWKIFSSAWPCVFAVMSTELSLCSPRGFPHLPGGTKGETKLVRTERGEHKTEEQLIYFTMWQLWGLINFHCNNRKFYSQCEDTEVWKPILFFVPDKDILEISSSSFCPFSLAGRADSRTLHTLFFMLSASCLPYFRNHLKADGKTNICGECGRFDTGKRGSAYVWCAPPFPRANTKNGTWCLRIQ